MLKYLPPKVRYEGTAAERATNFPSVSVANNGLVFYETDTGKKFEVLNGAWEAIYPNNMVNVTAVSSSPYAPTVDDCVILCDASGGAITINLPAAAGVTGLVLHIKKTDVSASLVTIEGDGSETIDGDLNPDLTSQYDSISIVSDGSNWHVL